MFISKMSLSEFNIVFWFVLKWFDTGRSFVQFRLVSRTHMLCDVSNLSNLSAMNAFKSDRRRTSSNATSSFLSHFWVMRCGTLQKNHRDSCRCSHINEKYKVRCQVIQKFKILTSCSIKSNGLLGRCDSTTGQDKCKDLTWVYLK